MGVVDLANRREDSLAGYMSLDTAAMPGNLGLKDAVEALRWVNKNIRSFGGDPSKVTLGGQSSGGVSASWLTILPATKGTSPWNKAK